jgi:glycosyltransferase involved in cell wall biosynthesis
VAAEVAPASAMRIVIVGPFGLRRKGTMSARALPMARALVAKGHRVAMLIPPWDSPADSGRRWTDAGVDIINIHLPAAQRFPGHVTITARLVRHVLNLHPDIVHTFKPKAYAGLTAAGLWLLNQMGRYNIPVVVDTDDWEGPGGWNDVEPYTLAQRAVFTWQESWGLSHCAAVTVASRDLETLTWALGIEQARVFYVPNGVPRQSTATPSHVGTEENAGATRALLYTRFVEFDVERLLAIWQAVLDEVPDSRLIVVGRGLRGEEQAFLQLTELAGIRQTITYLGWPGRRVMPGVFAATDVAILPFDDTLINRTKGTAKLAELVAAGLPVVADGVGQNREFVEHRSTGLLVPPGDITAFSGAVVSLLKDSRRRREMGAAARARAARHFTWDRIAETVEQAYLWAEASVAS